MLSFAVLMFLFHALLLLIDFVVVIVDDCAV